MSISSEREVSRKQWMAIYREIFGY